MSGTTLRGLHKSRIVTADRKSGNGFLSFTELEYILPLIPNGDTFTELDVDPNTAETYLHDATVRSLGGDICEYISPSLIVKRNLSLKDMAINQYLIRSADSKSLTAAAMGTMQSGRISTHFQRLGIQEAAEFWSDIESYTHSIVWKGIVNPNLIYQMIKPKFT